MFALHKPAEGRPARQLRHLSFIAEFTGDLRHVSGKDNTVADALSRPAAAVAPPSAVPLDWHLLAVEQTRCEETEALLSSTSLRIKKVVVDGWAVQCDFSTGVMRPVVPRKLRKAVFEVVHCLAHPGIRATQRLIAARYVWRGSAADVAEWTRSCVNCGKGKVTVQESTPVLPIAVPPAKFTHVHVDLVGPLPVAKSRRRYLLTIVDRTSRWPEAIQLRGITAEACIDKFITEWVARFGVPQAVTTDRGTQFTGAAWCSMCSQLGITHITTTAFHPQSNGLVERFHRQLKDGLRARGAGAAWAEHLPWVMLGLRAAPKEDAAVSSAEVVYGYPLVLPSQRIDQNNPVPPACQLKQIPLRQRSYAATAESGGSALDGVNWVFVRRGVAANPLAAEYAGPYRILRRNEKVVELEVGDCIEVVSADRLKPYHGREPDPALHPRRGRPPGLGGIGSLVSSGIRLGEGHVAVGKKSAKVFG